MPTPLLLTLVAVFVSVALGTGYVAALALTSRDGRRRLAEITRTTSDAGLLAEIMPLSAQEPTGLWADLARYQFKSPKELGRLKLRLMRAGFRHPGAAVMYSFTEMFGPIVVGAPLALLLRNPQGYLAAIFAALIAFFAPSLLVGRQLSRRRQEIEDGLPDALDLLVVCIEAGSGIDQSIQKASEELSLAYPALGDELRILTMETRAGKPRIEAFKNLAQRTKVDDVRALVAMLIQTDRFGTSIGQALRTHAEISRTRRRQRAEEQAQKIGVKLVFPLVLFFFPAFYIVVLGPAIIQFMHQFMGE